jgi:zinc protease
LKAFFNKSRHIKAQNSISYLKMNKFNRKIAPKIYAVEEIVLPKPATTYLDNGIPIHVISMGKIDAIRIEIIFNAGRPYEHKPTVARATAALLKEGTQNYSSSQIAEVFDFYGGSIGAPIGMDTSSVVMYSLNKHLTKLLPLFAEIVWQPTFPAKELNTFVENCIQDLQVELTKNEIIAFRQLTEALFGKEHPYGYNSTKENYKSLDISDLILHHNKHYHAGNATIIISGIVTPEALDLVNHFFGQKQNTTRCLPTIIDTPSIMPSRIYISREDSSQTAIAIGRRLFNRKHPDSVGMFVLNTILGGYFGSRLMANIREDKGYTYNIASSLEVSAADGYIYISTEVGNEFTNETLKEIYDEITKLQTDLVPDDELQMVKNYILGNMLNLLDGPFNVAEVYKTYICENLDVTHFDFFVKAVRGITPAELRRLAQQYFAHEDLHEVIVGIK